MQTEFRWKNITEISRRKDFVCLLRNWIGWSEMKWSWPWFTTKLRRFLLVFDCIIAENTKSSRESIFTDTSAISKHGSLQNASHCLSYSLFFNQFSYFMTSNSCFMNNWMNPFWEEKKWILINLSVFGFRFDALKERNSTLTHFHVRKKSFSI